MNSLFILVAAATLGIEVGWEPLPEGGHEYTIQIEPQLLDVLKEGKDEIFSVVPPELNVRRYRLLVGTGKLARVSGQPRPTDDTGVALGQQGPPHAERRPDVTLPETTDSTQKGARGGRETNNEPTKPERLHTADDSPNLLKNATYESPPETVHTKKPPSGPAASGADAEPGRPWFAFVTAMVFLCCSLGANIYLGWAAWDARSRYRSTLARLRAEPAS